MQAYWEFEGIYNVSVSVSTRDRPRDVKDESTTTRISFAPFAAWCHTAEIPAQRAFCWAVRQVITLALTISLAPALYS